MFCQDVFYKYWETIFRSSRQSSTEPEDPPIDQFLNLKTTARRKSSSTTKKNQNNQDLLKRKSSESKSEDANTNNSENENEERDKSHSKSNTDDNDSDTDGFAKIIETNDSNQISSEGFDRKLNDADENKNSFKMEVKNDYTHDSSVRNLDLNFGENEEKKRNIIDLLDGDYINRMIPFMHPETKIHTFKYFIERVHEVVDNVGADKE